MKTQKYPAKSKMFQDITERRRLGVCQKCEAEPLATIRYCEACRIEAREYERARRRAYRAERGVCNACGQELEDKQWLTCEACRDRSKHGARQILPSA